LKTEIINDIAELHSVQSKVRTAYNNEKIVHQTKESLKSQFKNREKWANGRIEGDSAPFDLIVDLNLIEIVLFGSLAQWEDDVYSFKTDEEEEGAAEDEPTGDDGTTLPTSPGGIGVGEAEDGPPAIPAAEEPEAYECVTTQELEALVGEEEASKLVAGRKGTLEPGEIPEGCGNGLIEGDEECDDGNSEAGDGCSISCTIESCSSLDCKDPEAVTLQQFEVPELEPQSVLEALALQEEGIDIPITCPSGSLALSQAELNAIKAELAPGITQPPGYSPHVGGTLKRVPPSNKPPCPPTQSTIQITIAGKTSQRCIPTKLCTDFTGARAFLFGEDYEDDPDTREAALAVEAMVCIDVLKILRPESPYEVNDGCIDCHILAMNDIMYKMLQKNVAPLENNMQAWGLSNRWGPNFYFDLVTSVKSLIRIAAPSLIESPAQTYIRKSIEFTQEANKQFDPNKPPLQPSVQITTSAARVLGDEIQNKLEAAQKNQQGS